MMPEAFPTVFLDRAVHALHRTGEMMIQMEATFPHSLDGDRLARAADLALDAEPILGCRLEKEGKYGLWRRVPETQRKVFSQVENDGDFAAFRAEKMDVETGPLLRVAQWPRSEGDRLLFKVAHEVADAGAAKRIVSLVSSIYARLADDPDHRPVPDLAGDRSVDQLTRCIPGRARPRILLGLLKEMFAQAFRRRYQTLGLDAADSRGSAPEYICRTFSKERVTHLKTYGRRYNATLNDLLVTACLRGLARTTGWQGERILSTNITIDLRRYLPGQRCGGICNMSAIEPVFLGRRLEDSFDRTLHRVSAYLTSRKKHWMGLSIHGTPMLRLLRGFSLEKYRTEFDRRYDMMLRKHKVAPLLTNMGVIPELTFEGVAQAAHLWVPPIYPPAVGFGLSGYRGSLTLTTTAFPGTQAPIDAFLDAVVSELPR
jgi:NRPS condensation-like uncharacterized protein